MARTKANSVNELIAVAELKDLLLSIDAKLDLLLNGKTAPATTVTLQDLESASERRGPDSWDADELKEWINGLDGITRTNIEWGMDPEARRGLAQEVWEAMKAEGW